MKKLWTLSLLSLLLVSYGSVWSSQEPVTTTEEETEIMAADEPEMLTEESESEEATEPNESGDDTATFETEESEVSE